MSKVRGDEKMEVGDMKEKYVRKVINEASVC